GSGEAFNDAGHTQGLARLLFTNYLLPFEITSVILTAGLVGVIALIRFHRVEKER
ncbi:MAG: NADH-quinone oxidoreductase subunit J, partial [Candidatus Poribacteria bacterium]|nr:NADH-quinone oxidoreductase subunit J [Candidatus Poribacteria bacterium]